MTDETRERSIERARKMQRIVNAYHRVFNSEDGKIVMEDLAQAFGVHHPAFLQVGTTAGGKIEYDDTYGKIRDGQRSVYLHIENRLRAPTRGDGNIGKPLVEVLTGMKE